jgi:hypothetical protein
MWSSSHLRTFVPDVVIAERHGDVEMSATMRAVQEDYARLIDQTKSEKRPQSSATSATPRSATSPGCATASGASTAGIRAWRTSGASRRRSSR